MTDIIIDDDLIDTSRPTASGSNSSITTSSRRAMFIETEVRTDTMTKRRVGSTSTGSRSVYDILENTRSPTDGLPPTTYTYAHSVSYMPVTEHGAYSVPVMARRDLHGDGRSYGSSSFTSTNSLFSSPTRFISNVRSHLANGYSAIRDRLTHHTNQELETETATASTLLNSPTTQRTTRFSRTSSQSSVNGQTTGYNLRRRAPVHSTPRDIESEQLEERKTTKQRKDRKSQDGQEETPSEEKEVIDEKLEEQQENEFFNLTKNLILLPIKLFKFLCSTLFSLPWCTLFSLPWWLLIPLLLLLGVYFLPNLACKSLEHYPQSKAYQQCRAFQKYRNTQIDKSITFLRENTFKCSIDCFKKCYQSLVNIQKSIINFLGGLYSNTRKGFYRQYIRIKRSVTSIVGTTKENAKENFDASVQKVNDLIEEFKREKDKFFGSRNALKPDQQQELEALVRQLLVEYSADETGQADYALEANGGKVVDTRCTEYTDEPRQHVVKFLGIPIVHMSKQPDIMIKAGRMPGQCFPFKGDQGSVIIKLAVPVKPTEFVLEHLSKSISVVGHINSAPNNFTVYALKDKNDKEGMVLGRYYYDAENGPPLQRFKPQTANVQTIEYVELRVTSNWGNPNYTCVYRFRVHGDLPSVQSLPSPAA
ncbi:unnamed protein product [Rotaria magnacalcarata]|uniref:SUN domain-containing protein n=5 Tax=Rotaria magnacalcarata TaxID=392030 RepID=A0A816CKN5_9BILA|nr:unnamed protein product [Rotaria magnacalcarata]